MAVSAEYKERLKAFNLIRTAFGVYKKGFKPIAYVSAAVSITIHVFFYLAFLNYAKQPSSAQLTLKEYNQFQTGAEILFGILSTFAVMLICHAIIEGRQIAPFTALKEGLKKYPKVFVTNLIMYVGILLPFIGISVVLSTDFRTVVYNNTAGKIFFILLVIAALAYTIYFSVSWVFNFVVVLIRDKWQFKALEHSRLAVKGSWWKTVFILGIALIIGAPIASLSFIAGSLFVHSGSLWPLALDVIADILTKFPLILLLVYFLVLEEQKKIA
ncbi:hypothetical protein KDK77_00405 [bacterium]|nr:hypothetical protein [bacterium]